MSSKAGSKTKASKVLLNSWRSKKHQMQQKFVRSEDVSKVSNRFDAGSPELLAESFTNMRDATVAIDASLRAYTNALRVLNTASKTLSGSFVRFFELFGDVDENVTGLEGELAMELAVKLQLLQHDAGNGYLVCVMCCVGFC
jgi:hypothetical protein